MSQLIWNKITNYKDAPSTCGVYQYWDQDQLLYIGKAINLRARLASHAQNAKLDAKENAIINKATLIKYAELDSEFLALLLEAKLIRGHMPPYNRIWKDDKTYLYIVINTKDEYPRPYFARATQLSKLNSRTFGPFPSRVVAEEVLRAIRRLVPFCTTKKIGKHKCFYSKIGLCNPCPGDIKGQKKLYRKQIFQVIKILSGNIEPVINSLTKDMKQASLIQDFENALKIRVKIERFTRFVSHHTFRESEIISYNTSASKLSAISTLLSKHYSNLSNLSRIECFDASNNLEFDATVSMVVSSSGLLDRGQYRRFKIKNPNINNDFDRLYEALARRLKNKTWPKPDLILIDGGVPQLQKLREIFDLLPTPIYYIGLAKHPDHLVLPNIEDSPTKKSEYINIQPDRYNLGFLHLQELRDEAHRFANNYRKLLQSKRTGI